MTDNYVIECRHTPHSTLYHP